MEESNRGVETRRRGLGALAGLLGAFGGSAVAHAEQGNDEEGEEKEKERTLKLPAIVGVVFNEQTGSPSGLQDEKTRTADFEVGLVKLEGAGGAGKTIARATTNADGVYLFDGIEPGRYAVRSTRIEPAGTNSPGYKVQGPRELEITLETTVVLGPILGKLG